MATTQHVPAPLSRVVPPGTRVYAVGDIHGRLDCLNDLLTRIEQDAEIGPERRILVFLGDYVDRGPDSPGVLDALHDLSLPGFAAYFLKGNHDDMMRHLLDGDSALLPSWLAHGGLDTLKSYGIRPQNDTPTLLRAFQEAVPPHHQTFLESLAYQHTEGDYLFVHAGVAPETPLDAQSEADLMWIREPFLSWPHPLEKMIVHGHSISATPDVTTARIGIDTGAYETGKLTCLVLEDDNQRYLHNSNS